MKVITPISDSIFKKLNEEELLLINELYLEMEKYKNVIDKIKEMFENNNLQEYYYGMSYEFEINDFKDDILELLEEVE